LFETTPLFSKSTTHCISVSRILLNLAAELDPHCSLQTFTWEVMMCVGEIVRERDYSIIIEGLFHSVFSSIRQ